MKISSQRYLNQEIVDRKVGAGDFIVTIAPVTYEDEDYEIVVDGHHALAAARQAGVEPEYKYSDYNYQAEVDFLGLEAFLESKWMDSDWYDIETGITVW